MDDSTGIALRVGTDQCHASSFKRQRRPAVPRVKGRYISAPLRGLALRQIRKWPGHSGVDFACRHSDGRMSASGIEFAAVTGSILAGEEKGLEVLGSERSDPGVYECDPSANVIRMQMRSGISLEKS
jgi:hypothetical protein